MSLPLEGQVVVVTGGARGIGKEIAVLFANNGADCALFDVNEATLAETVKEIEGLGRKATGIKVDVTDSAVVEDAVGKVLDKLGRIDILINNAGITQDGLLVRMSDDQWDRVLNINLKGTFLCTRSAAKHMMKQRSGAIVNIASVVGIMGNAGQANYSASKAGVIGLTKTTAKELAGRGVRCNAIAPGFIQTDMTDKLPEKAREQLLNAIPMGNLGQAQDVAQAALFLASKSSRYVTGQVLVVDGGLVM